MPGSGKSTLGIVLAKLLGFGFLDTDILIQINEQKTLQNIIDDASHAHLLQVEEDAIVKINIERNVIATGGSAAYSQIAMGHLKSISTVVFLKVEFEEVKRRIRNFETRGIAKRPEQNFHDLFLERQVLYERYADITIDCTSITQDQGAQEVASLLKVNGKCN